MPDFERVMDKISIDLAPTPEAKAEAMGFVRGKAYARREIGILCGVAVLFVAWILWMAT